MATMAMIAILGRGEDRHSEKNFQVARGEGKDSPFESTVRDR